MGTVAAFALMAGRRGQTRRLVAARARGARAPWRPDQRCRLGAIRSRCGRAWSSVDPRNDVGHYNLAVALAAAGQPDAAAAHYRAVLEVYPAHTEARRNLDRLDAARLEREANDLAAQGGLADAAARYQAALDHDAHRTHAHAALGMALASLGRSREAVPHLREAIALGETDRRVFNTLGGPADASRGKPPKRARCFESALARAPRRRELAHNLARLLVIAPG